MLLLDFNVVFALSPPPDMLSSKLFAFSLCWFKSLAVIGLFSGFVKKDLIHASIFSFLYFNNLVLVSMVL